MSLVLRKQVLEDSHKLRPAWSTARLRPTAPREILFSETTKELKRWLSDCKYTQPFQRTQVHFPVPRTPRKIEM